MSPRKAIPVAVTRHLLEECGYRCALPGCGETVGLERAHIEPHAKTGDDDFDNLIMLCQKDHWRYDQLGEITQESIRAYKRNLAVMNGRYNDFERRLLEHLASAPGTHVEMELSATIDLMLRNVVRDELVHIEPLPGGLEEIIQGDIVTAVPSRMDKPHQSPKLSPNGRRRVEGVDRYTLTEKGTLLVGRWFGAELIDEGQALE
ncbi:MULTISPECIES: HNH endonuclease signature motif containing protein [unclassified Pseudoclavibacter]|uniref:HNH endonuclease signature motif containing protein n=1 Tax=unclassified Pseudoclavibacter TaxID=2615177 RepID=UPI001BADE4FA|nr:HNH endonuclease signature motif containing protein [Pseudoclavibacter sp. Marseille-Q4354]MBS3177766.1 HNH endonuclease [Pseudoclavibacter sp. Marseille-Q4354]